MNNRKIEYCTTKTENEIVNECAGCGVSNPEYVMDDKRLCCDCYKVEKTFIE